MIEPDLLTALFEQIVDGSKNLFIFVFIIVLINFSMNKLKHLDP